MYQTKIDRRSLRSALLLSVASAAAIGFSAQASAQDQATETVVVTGSRIPQQGLYSPSPVTSIGQQELKFEGTVGVETLLNNLPSVFADQTSGVSNGSTGTATVDLRGLGANRTLVLVNGSRLMPGDPTVPVPDLDVIPASLVDHVEVLTGAASTVYGSDAVAGVVNFIMRKDFEGIEFDGQYGISQYSNNDNEAESLLAGAGDVVPTKDMWNGANETGTFLMGTNTASGKGNVTAYISYDNVEPVLASTRDYSACTLVGSTSHSCGGTPNFKLFASVDNLKGGVSSSLLFEQGTGKRGSGKFVPFTSAPSQLYNFGALNYLQRPDTRYSGGFFAHYEVNKELDIYTSFMFMDDHTVAQVAPGGLFFGEGAISGAAFNVNCNNPLLTAQEASVLCNSNAQLVSLGNACTPVPNAGNCNLTPGEALVEIGRRDIEGSPRIADFHHTAYRMQVGSRGDLGNGWTYDVYAQYGETVFQSTNLGYFSIRNSAQSLQATTNASGEIVCLNPTESKCVPLDAFNGIGSFSPQAIGFDEVPTLSVGYTEEQIISGSVTGDLGEWGIQSPLAKSPIAVSVGSEYRAEYLQITPDEEQQSADLSGFGGARVPVPRSGFNVREVFSEVKVPLVQQLPWFEDLSANAGYRYSSYNTSGAVTAYKYGAEWQPIDDIRFRASYERAVRAPDVLELFIPDNLVLVSAQDPCAKGQPTANSGECLSVANHGTALLLCPSSQCNQETGGSTALHPEIGNTRTIGAVVTPTFFDGFTGTVDYYNIDIARAIGSISPTTTLSGCYGATATVASQAFFCPLVHRNPLGQITGLGFVEAVDQNLGFEKTSGFDFEANYNFSFDDLPMTQGMGALQFAFVGTWLQTFVTEPIPGFGVYECAGLFGKTCSAPTASAAPLPKWRHRLRVTWTSPWDMDFSANWRYLSSVKLDSNQSNPLLSNGVIDTANATINSFWYLDFAADWTVRPGVELHGGVNNVFDRLPPLLSSSTLPTGPGNDNTFPGTYDALGRTMFVGATIKY